VNAFLAATIFAGIVGLAALPKNAEIVGSNGDIAGNNPVGNVKVYFTDGHAEMWTRKGGCIDPKVSESGQVGWIYCIGQNDRGWRILGAVRVVWPDEHHRDFGSAVYPYVDDWDFVDSDTSIVIKCSREHGPSYYFKYRLRDGQQLDEFEDVGEAALPKWAQPVGE
jgi:hypothetical protein